jgi:hypothetical protein
MEPNSLPKTYHFSSRKVQNNMTVPLFLGGIATSATVVSSITANLPESAISQKFKINETKKQLYGPIPFPCQESNTSFSSSSDATASYSSIRAPSAGSIGLTRTFQFNSRQAALSNVRSNDLSTAAICMPKEIFVRQSSTCRNNACRDSACKPSEARQFSEDTDDDENSCYSRQDFDDNRDTSSVEDIYDAFSDIDDEGEVQTSNYKRRKSGDSKTSKKKEDRQRWDADGLKNFAYGKYSPRILTIILKKSSIFANIVS